ncbi:hypothetical protein PG985_001582 [Apiospora marii]|uniref:uncharacterized protein n=1 Tax=Apiospora marii TaxID=335849 RepID=UPI00312EE23D
MAILPDLPGLETTIEVGGQTLQEYDVPEFCKGGNETDIIMEAAEDSYTVTLDAKSIPLVTKYVEATTDKQFGFRFRTQLPFTSSCHHLAIEAQFDGIRTPLRHLLDVNPFANSLDILHDRVVARCDGSVTYFDYVFKLGDLKVDEPGDVPLENLERQQHCAPNRGTLRLFVYKMNGSANRNIDKTARIPPSFADQPKELPREIFGPRGLKHRVYFERLLATRVLNQQYYDDYQDDMRRPCAIFEFRYRSKQELVGEEVIPDLDPIDGLSNEEIRRLALVGLEYEEVSQHSLHT